MFDATDYYYHCQYYKITDIPGNTHLDKKIYNTQTTVMKHNFAACTPVRIMFLTTIHARGVIRLKYFI